MKLSKRDVEIICNAIKAQLSSREGALLEKQKTIKHLKARELMLQSEADDCDKDLKIEGQALESLQDSHLKLKELLEYLQDDVIDFLVDDVPT